MVKKRLCGERGLKCLLEMFEKFKSKGDGHEVGLENFNWIHWNFWNNLILKYRDLDIILSKYEFWAHRLFPKMKFCDIVERLEKLGEKREVKVNIIIFLEFLYFKLWFKAYF